MQELRILDEETANNGGMIKGRQVAHLILEHFRTDRHIDQMWQIEDLYHIEYPGDNMMGVSAICDINSCHALRVSIQKSN